MSNHDEDAAARGGHARYGHEGRATGANQPKRQERKELREDWVPRQGGDQAEHGRRQGEPTSKGDQR